MNADASQNLRHTGYWLWSPRWVRKISCKSQCLLQGLNSKIDPCNRIRVNFGTSTQSHSWFSLKFQHQCTTTLSKSNPQMFDIKFSLVKWCKIIALSTAKQVRSLGLCNYKNHEKQSESIRNHPSSQLISKRLRSWTHTTTPQSPTGTPTTPGRWTAPGVAPVVAAQLFLSNNPLFGSTSLHGPPYGPTWHDELRISKAQNNHCNHATLWSTEDDKGWSAHKCWR